MVIAHAERFLLQKEARHGAWHAKFKKAVRDAETPEAIAAQRERLRRHTASQAARRFHSQLAKAQANVRQPLGRTAPVHEASRGDGTADEHCWQPRHEHGGGGDGGDGDGGGGGDGGGEGDGEGGGDGGGGGGDGGDGGGDCWGKGGVCAWSVRRCGIV